MIGVLTATCFLLALAVVLYFWGNKTAFNFIKMFLIFAILLDFIGLSGKAKMYPNELSGGEQQRVALARALVNNPSMLIADEPTGNLDPETAWDIMNLLNDINLRGTTVVVATHAKDIVDQMRKRVIEINKGTIVRDDKKGGYESEI